MFALSLSVTTKAHKLGQVDAGANWNRTFNNTMVAPRDGASSPNVTPIASESHEAEVDLRESGCAAVDQGKWNQDKSAGLGAERSAYEPCVCGRVINGHGDRIVTNVYVDDVRMYWETSDDARAAAADDQNKLYERHKIKWGGLRCPTFRSSAATVVNMCLSLLISICLGSSHSGPFICRSE